MSISLEGVLDTHIFYVSLVEKDPISLSTKHDTSAIGRSHANKNTNIFFAIFSPFRKLYLTLAHYYRSTHKLFVLLCLCCELLRFDKCLMRLKIDTLDI